MGYFASSGDALSTRLVNSLTPQGTFGMEQNRLLLEQEVPFYQAEIDSLSHPDAQQIELARELKDDLAIRARDGQRFGALWLNRESADSETGTEPLIVLNGFMANLTGIDDKMRAYFLARTLPERPILVVDQLSQGLSDKYNQNQRHELCDLGDLSGVGTNMYQAIDDFVTGRLPNAGSILLHADSFGARVSLDVAKASLQHTGSIPISQLQAFELPGTRNRRFGIHAAYFGYEWGRSKNYQKEWLESAKQSFVRYLEAAGPLAQTQPSFFRRDLAGATRNFWHSILGYDTGSAVLSGLIEEGLQVSRVVGGASRVDNPVHARRQWADMGKRFGLFIASHESHDGLGALTHARVRSRLIGSLTTHPFRPEDLPGVIEFNMSQFSNDGPLGRLSGGVAA
ncbi:MAG TPA: hypothetical protein VLH84_02315 [Patescibacteria group bacterium]|nr:hypothetical protein [Patescibacteria group bacterium]